MRKANQLRRSSALAVQPDHPWGSEPDDTRQSELDALYNEQVAWVRVTPDPRDSTGSIFAHRILNGSDVFYLAARSLVGTRPLPDEAPLNDIAAAFDRLQTPRLAEIPNLHLEHANLQGAFLKGAHLTATHLEGVDFRGAYLADAHFVLAHLDGADFSGDETDLNGADLTFAYLSGASLRAAQLQGSFLSAAHLTNADVSHARCEHADLSGIHLDDTDCSGAHFDGAYLSHAHLHGSHLSENAHLEGAYLNHAHLQGTHLSTAHLAGADLRGAIFSRESVLRDATFDDTLPSWWLRLLFWLLRSKIYGPAALGDIQWDNVDITAVARWPRQRLGDERSVRWRTGTRDWERVVRAYRQVAALLRSQNLIQDADFFTYRAQVRTRSLFLRRFHVLRYLGSLVLDVLAGYGYRFGRSIFWYLACVFGFAYSYVLASEDLITFGLAASKVPSLKWYEALVLSVASFHGRGFFQPINAPGDPVAILAAFEAIIGLVIEISFIATFTQRFFSR